jgi:Na+/H+ antiporter NhaD/arsenite permease-like protein
LDTTEGELKMNLNLPIARKINLLIPIIKKDPVLIIALLLALTSSFFNAPKLEYIDFKVLVLLFNLMLVVNGFKDLKVLDKIAVSLLKKCTTSTSIYIAIIGLTFISAMIVTNDVALITFVPLTIIIGKKAHFNIMKLVIFQTLAANLGSSFTPMGNPQNLYIYSYFNLSAKDFFTITAYLLVVSTIFLIVLTLKVKNKGLNFELESIKINKPMDILFFTTLFFIIILSVFHVINYKISFILTISTIFFVNKRLFVKVDYSLLFTFIAFFIFIGNMSSIEVIRIFMSNLLHSKTSTYLASIFISQFISNVPAAILLSNFTPFYKELLLGVNIGGLGTLIASLASVISYKIYTKEYSDNSSEYFTSFTFYNIIGLIIVVPIIYILNILL